MMKELKESYMSFGTLLGNGLGLNETILLFWRAHYSKVLFFKKNVNAECFHSKLNFCRFLELNLYSCKLSVKPALFRFFL